MTEGRARDAGARNSLTYSFFTLIFLLLGPTAPGVTGVECAVECCTHRRGHIIIKNVFCVIKVSKHCIPCFSLSLNCFCSVR